MDPGVGAGLGGELNQPLVMSVASVVTTDAMKTAARPMNHFHPRLTPGHQRGRALRAKPGPCDGALL